MAEASPTRISLADQLLQGAEQLATARSLDATFERVLWLVMTYTGAAKGVAALRHPTGITEVMSAQGVDFVAPGDHFSEKAFREAGLSYLYPIGNSDNPVGTLMLGGFPNDAPPEEELPYAKILMGIGGSVISNALAHEESQRLNEKLNQRIQELRALLDFGRGLTSVHEVEDVVQLLALTLAGRWAISRYAVHAWREGHDDVFRARGFTFAQLGALAARYKNVTEAILLGEDGDIEWLHQIGVPPGSMLIPLLSNERTIGLILCGLRMAGKGYSREDREFGLTMASRAAGSIENSWYFKETLIAREIERELSLAAAIQQDLFPKNMPVPDGWDVSARNRQARQVGGDYFDGMCLRADGTEKVLYVVSDVAGKGMGSALLMANMQATLRALLHHEPTIERIAQEANALLYASTPSNRYATAFLMLLDPATGKAEFVNCAHNNPVLLRASGEVELLDGPGLPLGMMNRSTQKQAEVFIGKGDALTIYTDGVSEAINSAEEEFGTDRLLTVLRRLRDQSARTIVDGVFEAIEYYVGDAPQHDDITLMVIKRNH
jgi:serine phosphatase RsbU (regulator of sigma subunit)